VVYACVDMKGLSHTVDAVPCGLGGCWEGGGGGGGEGRRGAEDLVFCEKTNSIPSLEIFMHCQNGLVHMHASVPIHSDSA